MRRFSLIFGERAPRRALIVAALLIVPYFSLSKASDYGIGLSVGPKYNHITSYQEWSGGSRRQDFNQLQFAEEVFWESCISNPFSLGLKAGLTHDIVSDNDLFDVLRKRYFFMAKIEPKVTFDDAWSVFADFVIGSGFFSDNGNSFMILGADAGFGFKAFEAADGKAKGVLGLRFEYIRGSYADEFGIGLDFSAMFTGDY
ncbi:MAG TPA: hypothetical protein DCO86_02885 [Spirochaetaceae bacterium]|nr:hypothetical protein [Spirochaetaceae bacterium]